MKRVLICLVAALVLGWPLISHAQSGDDEDQQNPNEYNDTWDGQALKLLSYILNPVGMALEWGLTRPLHYAATQTPVAPALSGDTNGSYMDRTDNASKVPPGTFGPYATNRTNGSQPEASGQALPPVSPPAFPSSQIQPVTPPQPSGEQPVIR